MENQQPMIEIERKFLVLSDDYKKEAFNITEISQGFLSRDKKRTIRVRLRDKKGTITVKGLSSKNGTSRFEWEKEISQTDAEALLQLCKRPIIEKKRYDVKVEGHMFEIDEFYGDNEGLVIAEIELEDENDTYTRPPWLGREVTGDIKYFNSQLSKLPYKKWK